MAKYRLRDWESKAVDKIRPLVLELLDLMNRVEALQMAKRKMAKGTVKKAHTIARAIAGGSVRNRYAVGMATAKKAAAKRKAKRGK